MFGEELYTKQEDVEFRQVAEAVDAELVLVDAVDPFDFYEDAKGG